MATQDQPPKDQPQDDAPPPYNETVDTPPNQDGDSSKTEHKKDDQQNEAPSSGEGLFGEPRNRAFAMGGSLIFWCIMTCWLYFYAIDTYSEMLDSFVCDLSDCDIYEKLLSANVCYLLGVIFIFIGSIICIVVIAFSSNKMLGIVALVLNVLGCLFTLIGYFIEAAEVDGSGGFEDLIGGSYTGKFCEYAIVTAHAVVLGLEAFKIGFLNDDTKRAIAMSGGIFALFGFIGGVGYAVAANWEYEYDAGVLSPAYSVENPLKDEMGCIAAGYIILSIVSLIRLLVIFNLIPLGSNSVTVGMMLAALTAISGFITAVGYWALIDAGDGSSDESNCWYMGVSFFVLIMAIVNALDMKLIENCKSCQTAGTADNTAETR